MLVLPRFLRFAVAAALVGASSAAFSDVTFHSARVMVVDEATGTVLFEKNAQDAAPMASLTKLLTVMVVLDAKQDPDEPITIDTEDLDTLKHTHSGVPPGATLNRAALIERALLASDNHAASSLARHFPGGMPAFLAAVRAKTEELKLTQTTVEEPTGLSPNNRSSAADLVSVLAAAATYPEISRVTSQATSDGLSGWQPDTLHNTNQLVGKKGWDILLSKTGFTNEAGRCLAMRLRTAGRTVLLVLLDASATSLRSLDALNISRWIAGDPPLAAWPAELSGHKIAHAILVRRSAKAAGRKAHGIHQASVLAKTSMSFVATLN